MKTAYELVYETAQQLGLGGRQFHQKQVIDYLRRTYPDSQHKDSTILLHLKALSINNPWAPRSNPSLYRRAFLVQLQQGYFRLAGPGEVPRIEVARPKMKTTEEKLASFAELETEVLAKLELDLNWVLAVATLAAQEVALVAKLKQLGTYQQWKQILDRQGRRHQVYTEFHDHLTALKQAMPGMSTAVINLVRGLREARNQLIHAGQHIDEDTLKAALEGTRMLLRQLALESPKR